jgi:Protein of unknown function (DUF4197)
MKQANRKTGRRFDSLLATRVFTAAFAVLLIAGGAAFAGTGDGPGGFMKVALGESQAAAGIKEALMTSTVDAVSLTGRPNGYFGNPAIRIGLPKSLKPLESGLKAVGLGPKLDQFELSMNRAAEAAAPLAKPIFEKAITSMTLTDAQRIVSGGGHSATDYFKAKTSAELTNAFTPVVKKTMSEYSVTKQYETLMGASQHSTLGLGGLSGLIGQKVDIDHYVVQKSLDGLFYMIGQEELKIRTNPAAQVTPLLRQVFGGGR